MLQKGEKIRDCLQKLKVWHPTFSINELKRKQLKDSANLFQYFKYSGQIGG